MGSPVDPNPYPAMAGCRKIPFGRIFTFIAAYWMVADIVLDFITTRKWKNECESLGWEMELFPPNGDITCKLWPLAAFFMVFPTVIMTFHVFCCGCYKGKSWEKLVYGPLYIVSVPLYAICTSTKSLFCPDRKEKERKSELSSEIKKLESEKLVLDEKLKSKSLSKEEENEYDRIKIELREKNYQ